MTVCHERQGPGGVGLPLRARYTFCLPGKFQASLRFRTSLRIPPTGLAISVKRLFDETVQSEFPLSFGPARFTHLTAQVSVGDQGCQALDKLCIISATDYKSGFTIFDKGWNISGIDCDYRATASHCLHDNVRAAFKIRSVRQKCRVCQEAENIICVATKFDSIRQSEVVGLMFQRFT